MKLSIEDLHFQYDGWTQKYTSHFMFANRQQQNPKLGKNK